MTKIQNSSAPSPIHLKPSSTGIAKANASMKKDRGEAEALLKQLGYKWTEFAPSMWHALVKHASGCLFLREKNRWQRKGKYVEHELFHRVHIPTGGLAEMFISTLQKKHPEFSSLVVLKPVEMLDDREIEIRHRVLMTTENLTKVVCDIDILACIYLGEYKSWSGPSIEGPAADADLSAGLQGWDIVPTKRLRMRLEFLSDVAVARVALAAYVCRWTDVDSESFAATGKTREVTTLRGHDVEFEFADDSLTLDQLRWLLNQIPDMHVAAESLNYAHLYTGERLNYEYFERMQPSDELVVKMAKTSLRLTNFLRLLAEQVETLQETLKAAAPSDAVFDDDEAKDNVDGEDEALDA
jgi:hypothetical protein